MRREPPNGNEDRLISQDELISKLDKYFNVAAFDESDDRRFFPPGYESIFEQYADPGYVRGTWNGLMLRNSQKIDRIYTVVFPAPNVLDKIIAWEVERDAPGALIFSHHMVDYQESAAGFSHISEAHFEELREHKISYYTCHAPLDCHPEISTSTALANALRVRDQARFSAYIGGLAGVHGKVGPLGFHEFARKCAEATGLPYLRYDTIRHNGRPIMHVAIVTGVGGTPDVLREAISLGCDTLVTGEWWLFGPGDWRIPYREAMRTFLTDANINLIGTSHYASEAVVMRDQIGLWVADHAPGIETIFVPQDDPWR